MWSCCGAERASGTAASYRPKRARSNGFARNKEETQLF